MPQTEEKKETSLNSNEQPKYTFAGGTHPDYSLDASDDVFYNKFNEDLKSDQPFMGNFWTKDGKLTKNHVNDPENNLVNYEGKIVSKNTLKRFQKINQRKQLTAIVPPEEISSAPKNINERISTFKNKNQSQYDKPLSKEEIAQAKKDNKEVVSFTGWRGADGGKALTAKEQKAQGAGPNVFVNETRLQDPRTSQDIINERDELLTKLVDEDEFINNEFWKTVVHNKKGEIDTYLKDLQGKYDTLTEDGYKDAMKDYNNYINGLIEEAVSTDKNFQDRIAFYEEAVNAEYGNRIRNLQQKEGAEEILPDWAEGSPFLAGVYTLFGVQLPQAKEGTLAAFQAKDLEAITKQYNEIKDLPDDAEVGGEYRSIPGAMAPITVRDKTTAGEQKKKLLKKQTEVRAALLNKLTKAEGYGAQMQALSQPEMFDENFNLDLSFDEVKSMYGTQAGQMILAGLTAGGSTFLQETSGIFLDTLREKALEKSGLSEEEFNKLSNKEKSERYIDIIDAGEGDMDNAFIGGGINALMDTASNFFVLGKVAKGLPKNSLKQLFRGQIREGLKTAGKGTGDVLKSAGAEFFTEIGQEMVSSTTTGISTDKINNLGGWWNKMSQKESLKQFAEAGGQAVLSTVGLSGGGKVAVGGVKEIYTNIAASLDPEHALNIANRASSKAILDFKKIKNPTAQQKKDLDDQLAKIDLAVDFVNNTKYKNLKGKPKELVFNNVVAMKDNDLKIENLKSEIKAGTEGDKSVLSKLGLDPTLQTMSDQEINQKESEIKILEEENTKLLKDNTVEMYNQNYSQNGKTFAQWINDQKEGDFANKTVTTFKTLAEARKFFEKKYKNQDTPKDIQSFLDGNDNAINFENRDIYAIDERIKSNIKKGDVTSGNAIHHEILHYMLDGVSNKDLSRMRREIMSSLSNSEDSTLVQMADKIKKLKGYKNYATREGNEEFFAALSDTFAMAEAQDISLPVNTTLTKIGNAFSGMFTSNTNQGMAGAFSNLKNGAEMLSFIKKYNKVNGKQSVFNRAELPTFGLPESTVTKRSKSMQEDINNTLVDTIKNPETNQRDRGQAIKSIIENNPIIYKALGFNVAKGTVTQAEIDSAITAELLGAEGGKGIINTYDGSTKFSTYLQNIFSARKQKIYEMAGLDMKGAVTGSLQAEQAREVIDTDDVTGKVDKKDPSKLEKVTKKVLSKEFNFDGYDLALVDAMSSKDFKVPKDYKSAVDHDPSLVAELFGVDPDQYTSPTKSLKKQDVINARLFIKKNPELLHSILPNNLTSKGKATGVRNILLDAFYTKADKKEDAKFGKSKQGSFKQAKNPFNQKEFLAAFGMGKDLKMMKVLSQTQQSGIIKALMNEVGKAMTNQAIRKNEGAVKNAREKFQNLRDGTAKTVWSRSLVGGVNGLNSLLEQINQKPLNPNNKNDRKLFKRWMSNTFPKYFPNSLLLSDTFGPTTNRTGNFFFDKKERAEVKNIIKGKETHNLTENEIKQLQALFASKKEWFGKPTSKKFEAKIKDAKKGLDVLMKQLNNMVKDNPANAKYIAGILASQANATQHGFRQMALPELGVSGLKGKLEKEHVIPANWFVNFVLDTAITGKDIKARTKWLKDNYIQLGILKEDDTKVADAGFKTTLPDEFLDAVEVAMQDGNWNNVPSPVIRYVHPKVNAVRGGLDLNKIPYKGTTIANNYGLAVNASQITPDVIAMQQRLAFDIETGKINKTTATQLLGEYLRLSNNIKQASNVNVKSFDSFITPDLTVEQQMKALRNVDKALAIARDPKAKEKGITILDFDDTVAISESTVIVNMPDGTTKNITPAEFALESENLESQGATFDFSEFNQVIKGRKGPLFDLALKRQEKFGNDDIVILTARPQASALAIQKFAKGLGLNLKLENITGLEDGSAQSKARFVIDKAAQGYNDFYFADDALKNVKAVQNVLDVIDVKRDVQLAKRSKFLNLGQEFDQIIQDNTGLSKDAIVSDAKAKSKGATRGNWFKDFFIPHSAEDFTGLMYTMIGKGKKGEKQWKWMQDNLIKPFARGIRDLNAAKQVIANEFATLKRTYPAVTKALRKDSPIDGYTNAQAMRVYIWNKLGMKIPGLTKTTENALVKHVKNNPDMVAFADQASNISRLEDGYIVPDDNWVVGNFDTDMQDATGTYKRQDFLKEYLDNSRELFTPERLNKLELIYGSKFVEALQDMLYRMEYGTNRSSGMSRQVNNWLNWVNNSVGAIMFFNFRSAALQTLSSFNFMNWSDNNPLKAGMAFANQKQFWNDFAYIFNHPTLKQRRSGMDIDVNAAEIAQRVGSSKNPVSAALNYLLQIGFTPTRMADSFAIAVGGASMYRNRINTYMKKGLDKKAAEEKAFLDFQEISEATQQSARPDMVSQQQAGPLGRLVLAFQVTPMQYARLIKRSAQDLAAGRGDAKTHISKIIYYGAVQNVIFNALQNALFAIAFADDEEEDEKLTDKQKRRVIRTANNMADSLLRGLGVGGAAVATVKNMVIQFLEQEKRGYRADHAYTMIAGLNISPPIGSKARKVYSATQTYKFNRDAIKEMGFSLDNPGYEAVGNFVSGTTNVPLDRVIANVQNARDALDKRNEAWQRLAVLMGWNSWDVNIPDRELQKVKEDIKKRKAEERRKKKKK